MKKILNRLVKFETQDYSYSDITYDRAKRCWDLMKREWESGRYNVPHLHRGSVRLFYHAVTEDGLVKSGLSTIPLKYGIGKTEWRKINDIEDDHFTAPEGTARYMYAVGESFFLDKEQFENKFLGWFLWSKQTHYVSGEFNQELKSTSGKMKDNSNIFQKLPDCTTEDKYPRGGIRVMYDIENENKEIPVREACPVPLELTRWQSKIITEKMYDPMGTTDIFLRAA